MIGGFGLLKLLAGEASMKERGVELIGGLWRCRG